MSHSRRPKPPAYVIDAGTLCYGILAFCRGRAIRGGTAIPAAVLLDTWLKDDAPTFEWVYSEEMIVVYETVLRRLGLASKFVDRVIGTIRQMGKRAVPPFGIGDATSTMEEVFCAAAEAAEEASIVTPDPASFGDSGRIRVLSPIEAVADVSGHAAYADRAAGLAASERPIDPIAQRWPA